MSRTAWIVSGSLAALLVVVAILLVVIIGQNNAAAADAEHKHIVSICEGQIDDPYGSGLGQLTECIDRLKD